MEEIIIDLGALILFFFVHYVSSRVTYNEWRTGGEEIDPSKVTSDYFIEGGPHRVPFYKKIFSAVVLAILVTLFAIAYDQKNFRMQQIVLTIITIYCFFWFFIIFNVFIVLRNRVKESLGNLDSQLVRRNNLIKNMVSVVKQYTTHEKDIFNNIAETRSGAVSTKENIHNAYASHKKISQLAFDLVAVAEKYPEIKADTNYINLQKQLSRTESMVQGARSYYNDCVSEYNTQIELFPAKVIAKLGNFKKYEFFKGKKEDNLPIKI